MGQKRKNRKVGDPDEESLGFEGIDPELIPDAEAETARLDELIAAARNEEARRDKVMDHLDRVLDATVGALFRELTQRRDEDDTRSGDREGSFLDGCWC